VAVAVAVALTNQQAVQAVQAAAARVAHHQHLIHPSQATQER
jgi:hypothetical protein